MSEKIMLFGSIAVTYFIIIGFFSQVAGWDERKILALMAPIVIVTMFLIVA